MLLEIAKWKIISTEPRSCTKNRSVATAGTMAVPADDASPEIIEEASSWLYSVVLNDQMLEAMRMGSEMSITGLLPTTRMRGTQKKLPSPRASMLKHVRKLISAMLTLNVWRMGRDACKNLVEFAVARNVKKHRVRYVRYLCHIGQFYRN